ncbi:flagellar protein FlgN [Sporolactobacillus sp. THM7-4]|nr:flagellar protein FlgN [Sporolactobacillus sp. THM7-4]
MKTGSDQSAEQIPRRVKEMALGRMKTIVRQLIDVNDQLYHLALQKTEAIKSGDDEKVNEIAQLETPLVGLLESLEEKRKAEVSEDLRHAGGIGSKAMFSEWERIAVPEEKKAEWRELYERLVDSVYSLKQANQLNQDLLRESLQWVRLSLNLLQPQIRPTNYGNPNGGHDAPSPYTGRIDSRA